MKRAETTKESSPNVITGVSLLTVLIIKDNGRYMAKCPELDLITEMDTKEEALKAMVELIREYAEDYKAREEIYLKSPNRAHHKPYIDRIIVCQDEWEIMELIGVRYGHLHVERYALCATGAWLWCISRSLRGAPATKQSPIAIYGGINGEIASLRSQ